MSMLNRLQLDVEPVSHFASEPYERRMFDAEL